MRFMWFLIAGSTALLACGDAIARDEVWKDPLEIVGEKNVKPWDGKLRDGRPYHAESYMRLGKKVNDPAVELLFGEKISSVESLGVGHYYTAFAVLNFLKDDNFLNSEYCAEYRRRTPSLFLGVKLRVSYRGLPGSPTYDFVPWTVILSAGKDTGESKASGDSDRGCRFKSIEIRTEGPYILHTIDRLGQGQYELHFAVDNGTIDKPSTTEQFLKLITSALGILPMVHLPAGSKEFAQEATKAYDSWLNSLKAYSISSDAVGFVTPGAVSATADSRSGPFLKIRLPWLQQMSKQSDLGHLEVYSMRSVSKLVDSEDRAISATDVMSHPTLGWPHKCIPGTGDCPKPEASKTFSERAGDIDLAKLQDTSEANSAEWVKLFLACKKNGDTATQLGLSTIDKHLVRWAFVHREGLAPFFEEEAKIKALEKIKLSGFAKPAQQLCWSADDRRKLEAIAKLMEVRFQEN